MTPSEENYAPDQVGELGKAISNAVELSFPTSCCVQFRVFDDALACKCCQRRAAACARAAAERRAL
jgi:hypothetical protein